MFNIEPTNGKLVDYYLSNPQISPIEPLFALGFEHAFEIPTSGQPSENRVGKDR